MSNEDSMQDRILKIDFISDKRGMINQSHSNRRFLMLSVWVSLRRARGEHR
jgi:hypothetical protein